MERMRAPDAPVLDRRPYGRIEFGFMRNSDGEIFFLAPHGRDTLSYPVLKDGSLVACAEFGTFDLIEVDLIHPKDLGFAPGEKIRWVKPGTYEPI